jgi:hypothetical protein
MKPVTPGSMTSGTLPARRAITGVPHASASGITSPNGSGQVIGNSSAAAPPSNASRRRRSSSPRISTLAVSSSGSAADRLSLGVEESREQIRAVTRAVVDRAPKSPTGVRAKLSVLAEGHQPRDERAAPSRVGVVAMRIGVPPRATESWRELWILVEPGSLERDCDGQHRRRRCPARTAAVRSDHG